MDAHVLLVEDDSTARLLLADVLKRAGYTVTTAPDGETAVSLLQGQHYFDVVITDLRMRSVDGIGVLGAARGIASPPEVIVLTGFGGMDSAIAALRTEAFDYLLKPCNPDDLLRRVAQAATHRRELAQRAEAVNTIARSLSQLTGTASSSDNTPVPALTTPIQPIQTPSLLDPSLMAAPAHQTAEKSSSATAEEVGRFVRVSAISIDTYRHVVTFDSRPVHLTPTEYSLLLCLAEAQGRVMSYQDIVRRTHNCNVSEGEAQVLLKAHIRNLRRKVASGYIVSVRGVGYMLAVPDSIPAGMDTDEDDD